MTETPQAPLITLCREALKRHDLGGLARETVLIALAPVLVQCEAEHNALADHLDRAARFARWLEDEIEARTRSLPTALSDTERDQMIVGIQAREKVLAEYRRLGLSGSAAAPQKDT